MSSQSKQVKLDPKNLTIQEIYEILSHSENSKGRKIKDIHDAINNNRLEISKAIDTRLKYFKERDIFKYKFFSELKEILFDTDTSDFDKGLTNPIEITKVKNSVHISSSQRSDILNTASSNYKISLAVPLVNVLSIKLKSYSIPMSWYTIDSRNNTIIYSTTNNADNSTLDTTSINKITLPIGNYSAETLATTFITEFEKLSTAFKGDIKYSKSLQRILIDKDFQGSFILAGFKIEQCGTKKIFINENSNKLETSLGYLLGFRSNFTSKNLLVTYEDYIYTDASGVTTATKMLPGLVSTTKHTLFHIILDEKQLNRQSYTFNSDVRDDQINDYSFYLHAKKQNLIHVNSDSEIITTCNPDQDLELSEEACFNNTEENVKKSLLYDKHYSIHDKIPKAQYFSEMLKKTKPEHQHNIKLNISNLFYTIMFNPRSSKVNPDDDTVDVIVKSPDKDCRVYFGAVSISKFNVTLLDQNGIIVDLNNLDWSLELEVEQLYQHS